MSFNDKTTEKILKVIMRFKKINDIKDNYFLKKFTNVKTVSKYFILIKTNTLTAKQKITNIILRTY